MSLTKASFNFPCEYYPERMSEHEREMFRQIIIMGSESLRKLREKAVEFTPKLALTRSTEFEPQGYVSYADRNNVVQSLKYFKVFFDQSSQVLCAAVNFVDLILTRTIVKTRHLEILCVASFTLAASLYSKKPVEIERMIQLAGYQCSSNEVHRMIKLLTAKLNVESELPTTVYDFTTYYELIFNNILSTYGYEPFIGKLLVSCDLISRMEWLLLDDKCVCTDPSLTTLALFILYINWSCDQYLKDHQISKAAPAIIVDQYERVVSNLKEIWYIMNEVFPDYLLNYFGVTKEAYEIVKGDVAAALNSYHEHGRTLYCQQKVWKVGHPPKRILRPLKKFETTLQAIEENPPPKPKSYSRKSLKFSRRRVHKRH